MFGLLKSKISSFITSLSKREEEKAEEAEAPAEKTRIEERKPEPVKPAIIPKAEEARPAPKPEPAKKEKEIAQPAAEKKPAPVVKPAVAPAPKAEEKMAAPERPAFAPAPKAEEKKMKVSLSLESRVKGLVLGQVEIKEKDIDDLLRELEMSMLEADVAFEVSQALAEDLKGKLVGKKVRRGDVERAVRESVASALRDTMDVRGPDLLKAAEEKKMAGEPLKILFVGPNGAGKTTTMAKIAELFIKNRKSVVFSASDSYRAAAIEQTEAHGNKLGLKTIKHGYGADPAAVCFDAINYAKAHKIDVVLMDTAGRQETNRNLVDEMKKMARVAKPDLKIFVGESIAGNALVEQVRSFNEAVGLDGVILTKLDCDAKGGTALSVTKATGVPILYFGVGQAYGDLKAFDADFVVSQLLG